MAEPKSLEIYEPTSMLLVPFRYGISADGNALEVSFAADTPEKQVAAANLWNKHLPGGLLPDYFAVTISSKPQLSAGDFSGGIATISIGFAPHTTAETALGEFEKWAMLKKKAHEKMATKLSSAGSTAPVGGAGAARPPSSPEVS